MNRILLIAVLCGLSVLMLPSANAVEPEEMLADPALEARAREISREIRCPVCRNESIDDSNAGIARDLRLVVRERIAAGETDDEVKRFLVERYGEFVLLKPTFGLENLALWLTGPALLVLGVAGVAVYLRGRRRMEEGSKVATAPLTPKEKAELKRLISKQSRSDPTH